MFSFTLHMVSSLKHQSVICHSFCTGPRSSMIETELQPRSMTRHTVLQGYYGSELGLNLLLSIPQFP